ncbi:MAG: GTP-binding protein [Nanobdellota archaeon]
MDQMNVVIVGHVDHGKSTIIGRMLAETNSLPEGKLEQVKERCRRESKNFEYAYLLDALKDEQSQGITIDSARVFFKTENRHYIIIDAPGHIEFLKNMISGAARAEAALLVIDADEGVQENSKRHGYMLSMLGITQVFVCVNKMDLVDYSQERFEKIKKEYSQFLSEIGVEAKDFIPVSGLEGDNISEASDNLSWFDGSTVLSTFDQFEKESPPEEKPFRMPVQGVYKFTRNGDNRRIVAGTVTSGTVKVGDEVIFLPSNKKSTVKSIEAFSAPERKSISAGYATGFTLTEQIFINRGDVMCRVEDTQPYVSSGMKVSIFWMGRNPMMKDKEYNIKLGTMKVPFRLKEVSKVLDASSLENEKKERIERHEVAEAVLELQSPIAYDLTKDIQSTGRFVIVDDYEISGGGIITENIPDEYKEVRDQAFLREKKWDRSIIPAQERSLRYGQKPKLVLITGETGVDKKSLAKQFERKLFDEGRKPYFLGIGNLLRGLDADINKKQREEHIRRLAEVGNILLDAGLIVIATASDLTHEELRKVQTILSRDNIMIVSLGDAGRLDGVVDLHINEKDGVEKNIVRISEKLRFNRGIY